MLFARLHGRTIPAFAGMTAVVCRYRHFWKSPYFPAIDHEILKRDLRRRIACEQTLWLIDAIIDGSNPQEPVHLYFPGDDLFSPLGRRRGLPIGNLTSQLFANIYLDGLDHYVKEVLRAPYLLTWRPTATGTSPGNATTMRVSASPARSRAGAGAAKAAAGVRESVQAPS